MNWPDWLVFFERKLWWIPFYWVHKFNKLLLCLKPRLNLIVLQWKCCERSLQYSSTFLAEKFSEKKRIGPFVSSFNEIASIDGHETDRRQIPIRIDKIVAANFSICVSFDENRISNIANIVFLGKRRQWHTLIRRHCVTSSFNF